MAHLELRVSVAQVCEPTNPEAMFRQPLAKVSILKTLVEATPATVNAVVEADGKVEALVVVAVKYEATTCPTTDKGA